MAAKSDTLWEGSVQSNTFSLKSFHWTHGFWSPSKDELNLSLLPLMKQRSGCNIYGNNSPSWASRDFFHFFPSETTASHWLWFSQFSHALILIRLLVRPAGPLYRLWQRKKKKKQQLNTLGVSGSFRPQWWPHSSDSDTANGPNSSLSLLMLSRQLHWGPRHRDAE